MYPLKFLSHTAYTTQQYIVSQFAFIYLSDLLHFFVLKLLLGFISRINCCGMKLFDYFLQDLNVVADLHFTQVDLNSPVLVWNGWFVGTT